MEDESKAQAEERQAFLAKRPGEARAYRDVPEMMEMVYSRPEYGLEVLEEPFILETPMKYFVGWLRRYTVRTRSFFLPEKRGLLWIDPAKIVEATDVSATVVISARHVLREGGKAHKVQLLSFELTALDPDRTKVEMIYAQPIAAAYFDELKAAIREDWRVSGLATLSGAASANQAIDDNSAELHAVEQEAGGPLPLKTRQDYCKCVKGWLAAKSHWGTSREDYVKPWGITPSTLGKYLTLYNKGKLQCD